MTRVFVSYSRSDETFARKLATSLSKMGARVWIDIEDIPAGMKWSQAIQEGLDTCDVMIVIISPDSAISENVQDEWQYYLDQAKSVIPVLYRPAKMHFQLNRLQYINFFNFDYDTAFKQLEAEILRIMTGERRESKRSRTGTHQLLQEQQDLRAALPAETERQRIKIASSTLGLGLLLLVVLILGGVILLLGSQQVDSPQEVAALTDPPGEANEEAGFPRVTETKTPASSPTRTSPPSRTPTITQTTSPTPFSQETAVELTIDAQLNQFQTESAQTAAANAAATARSITRTAQARSREETATATLFTATPTPDVRATAAARLTATVEKAEANQTATQRRLDLTLTATLWTATPTPLPGYSAGRPISRNAEWEVVLERINEVEMVLAPVGCFMMGLDSGTGSEFPAHQQCFEQPFWIDRTEVTRGQYGACIAAGVCPPLPENEDSSAANQPVNDVPWLIALSYCAWRGSRLPTEAEWEYAARGPDNLTYPWGAEIVLQNSVNTGNSDQTQPVGGRSSGASWVGALDMSGNVWEWTSSIRNSYPYRADDGREDRADQSAERVLRGGSFLNPVIRLSFRDSDRPNLPRILGEIVGFRCVKDY